MNLNLLWMGSIPLKSNRYGIEKPALFLKNVRERIGLSQIKMGKILGVTTQCVYFWEKEKREIGASSLELIVSLDLLFNETTDTQKLLDDLLTLGINGVIHQNIHQKKKE